MGFEVYDIEATQRELKAAGVRPVPMEHHEPRPPREDGQEMVGVNLKYLGPDEVHFDVRQKGWDEAIELAMDRYELAPVKQAAE